MSQRCVISREIGIDVGHRVPDHGSKCRNPHGHRYRVIATCEGPVMDQKGNEENGMVVDFGNLKKYMMDIIDAVFDHGFVVYKGDKAMMDMFFPIHEAYAESTVIDHVMVAENFKIAWQEKLDLYTYNVKNKLETKPLYLYRTSKSEQDPEGMKVIIVDYVPTAENLAKHFYEMLAPIIAAHYGEEVIRLKKITLYETPNGWVDYEG